MFRCEKNCKNIYNFLIRWVLFVFFLFQCLWKVVRNLPKTISEVKVDQILLDIHTFLLIHPHQMWKNRADDTPLRTIKTVLYTLGKLKKQEVSNVNLSSLNFLVCSLVNCHIFRSTAHAPLPLSPTRRIDSRVVKLRRALSSTQWNSIATELP